MQPSGTPLYGPMSSIRLCATWHIGRRKDFGAASVAVGTWHIDFVTPSRRNLHLGVDLQDPVFETPRGVFETPRILGELEDPKRRTYIVVFFPYLRSFKDPPPPWIAKKHLLVQSRVKRMAFSD